MKMNLLILLGTLLIAGCGGDNEEPLTLPTNLQIATEVSADAPGKLNVTATAQNANYYVISFGEDGSSTTSTDGKASYTYKNSGNYIVSVYAHTTSTAFVSATKPVTITLKEENQSPTEGYTTPLSYNGYTLVWSDEFDGTALNTGSWSYEIGTGSSGWGNNELQYYRQENTTVKDGLLTITARKESFSGSAYTSSRIITKGKKEFKYGRIDIRAALPKGQGIWPALWMLGKNISEVSWPKCGEIDIMEMIGGSGREKTVHGTLHWDDNGHKCTCDKPGYSLSSGTFNDKFHVFTIIWDATNIKWYVDDVLFNTINITPAALSEFHNEYFFIINLAVGGNWPGNPDGTTTFPQELKVDYVRIFQVE